MHDKFWTTLAEALSEWEKAKAKRNLRFFASSMEPAFTLLLKSWTDRWWGTSIPYDGVQASAEAERLTGMDHGFDGLLDDYEKEAHRYLARKGDERFRYLGVNVRNPEGIPDKPARRLLEGLDYVAALFKRRGVDPKVLLSSLAYVELTDQDTPTIQKDTRTQKVVHRTPSALYRHATRSITLNTALLSEGKTRVLDVMLHEVAHLIHLDHLHPEARALWNKPWATITQKAEEATTNRIKTLGVTLQDRQRYWTLLVNSKGSLAKLKGSLKGLDKLKFHAWLKHPLMGDPYVTPKNLRWTPSGLRLQQKLEAGLTPADERRYQSNLAADDDWDGLHPYISPEEAQAFLDESGTNDKELAALIDALEIPTEYGKTDREEDFAETFVVFMQNPGDLSPTATLRMQQALALSGLYNKQVLRLASEAFHPVKLQPPTRQRKKFPFTGFIDFQGLQIDVENAAGSSRQGLNDDGSPWSVTMFHHYGEIRDTEGSDGDPLDVYVGPNHDSSLVVVIHQHNPFKRGNPYDEDKVMLGFDSPEEAVQAYLKQYDQPGFYVPGDYTELPIGAFWRWVHDESRQGRKLTAKLATRYLKDS